MRNSRRFIIVAFSFTLALSALSSLMISTPAEAEDLSGFSVVLQRGATSAPDAIDISPDGRWFLTADGSEIHLSDVESGAVLRTIVAPVAIGRVIISRDGRDIFAETAPYEKPEQIVGWKAETGAPIPNAQAQAPAKDDENWRWIYKWWPRKNGPALDMTSSKKYLVDLNIAQLVDVDRVKSVEPTNRENVVQVTVAGEPYDRDEAFAAYHYYFLDIVLKRVVVEIAGKALNTFCGQPHGTFAFNGRYLIIAPTELDGSSSFINSMVFDIEANPPLLKWSRPCQDWHVAGLGMARGLIDVRPQSDKARIWDPATARLLAALDDVHEALNWSGDRTTFAGGYAGATNPSKTNEFGVSLIRSGMKIFIPTAQKVKEIRLNHDGRVVFAQTEAGWAAWNTSNRSRLPSRPLPPSENDFSASDSSDANSPDGKFRIVNQRELVDVASGRLLVNADGHLSLSYDSSYVWAPSRLSGFTVWDAASGQEMWTATANDELGEEFLLIRFPDGRVRLSQGAEKRLKLVRGFQVRPFDDAARQAFVRP